MNELVYRAKYPLDIENKLINIFGHNQLMGYDIGCNFAKTADCGAMTGPKVHNTGHLFICGSFHGHAHCRLCQLDWHPLYWKEPASKTLRAASAFFMSLMPLLRKLIMLASSINIKP